MKTIMIATDFSTSARTAAMYGVQLAKAMNANIILFTAYHVAHSIAAISAGISHYDVMMQTENKLSDERDAIADGGSAEITLVCEEGNTEKTILAIAVEKGADLIIVGMKGEGKNIKKLFGSIATALIKSSPVPVIIVPEEAKFSKLTNIVYASGVFLDITIQPIEQIQWMTDYFKSKLYVARVVKDDYEKLLEEVNVPHRLSAALRILNTTFGFPVNENISAGLNEFISEQPVDLLVMKPHKHEWIERIFTKSETKDMAFHTHIPLLVLPQTPGEESRLIVKKYQEEMFDAN